MILVPYSFIIAKAGKNISNLWYSAFNRGDGRNGKGSPREGVLAVKRASYGATGAAGYVVIFSTSAGAKGAPKAFAGSSPARPTNQQGGI